MIRSAHALWKGNLRDGDGSIKLGSGVYEGKYSFGTRFEDEPGTNPEELIGAAHAGCFSMAFSAMLTKNGFTPDSISTEARVHLEKVNGSFKITRIELITEAKVPGIDGKDFQAIAGAAKDNCPVSMALSAVPLEFSAKLL